MNPSHDLQGLKKKAKETFLYVLSALLLGNNVDIQVRSRRVYPIENALLQGPV